MGGWPVLLWGCVVLAAYWPHVGSHIENLIAGAHAERDPMGSIGDVESSPALEFCPWPHSFWTASMVLPSPIGMFGPSPCRPDCIHTFTSRIPALDVFDADDVLEELVEPPEEVELDAEAVGVADGRQGTSLFCAACSALALRVV